MAAPTTRISLTADELDTLGQITDSTIELELAMLDRQVDEHQDTGLTAAAISYLRRIRAKVTAAQERLESGATDDDPSPSTDGGE